MLDKTNPKVNIRSIIYLLFLLAYAVFHVYLINCHEAWRDEAQAWTLAANISLPQLFSLLSVEGHPALWFLFLRIFAKLGLTFPYISYLSLILMLCALAMLLFKSPFPDVVKLAVSLSLVFIYYNPVISRVYSLIILLVVILAVYWPQKYDKPILYGILIALLFQTHIIMSGLACGLMACMFFRCIKRGQCTKYQLIGTLIAFISFCLLIFELYPRSSTPASVDVSLGSILTSVCTSTLIDGFFILYKAIFNPDSRFIMYIVKFFLLYLAVVLMVIIFRRKFLSLFDALFVSLCGLSAIYLIITFVYYGTVQMQRIFLFVGIFSAWIICSETDDRIIKTMVLLMIAVPSIFSMQKWFSDIRADISNEYSSAKTMSEYIVNELPDDSVVLLSYDSLNPPVVAYTEAYRDDIVFFDIDGAAPFDCHIWKLEYSEKSVSDIDDTICDYFPETSNIYYLTSKDYPKIDVAEHFASVFDTGAPSIIEEDYILYLIR